ncbi:2 putative-RELATED [Salix viminalis]|uniref:2 putative-RELATED n=1 Tax=Salix viminalis TaxID=40686 RepID=A0A9Q0UWP8_SALVM|nr:2 putative-RELATED [Salix viminalis]
MAAGNIAPQILTLLSILSSTVNSIDFNYPAVFNFGDSNSDTGDLAAGLGFLPGPPYGRAYFKTPTARFCDGRLIVDFLSKVSISNLAKHCLFNCMQNDFVYTLITLAPLLLS